MGARRHTVHCRREANSSSRKFWTPVEPAAGTAFQIPQMTFGSRNVMFASDDPAGQDVSRVDARGIILMQV